MQIANGLMETGIVSAPAGASAPAVNAELTLRSEHFKRT